MNKSSAAAAAGGGSGSGGAAAAAGGGGSQTNQITYDRGIIGEICDFLQDLKVKARPLETMIEEAEALVTKIRKYLEELGELKEKTYFWRFINDDQRGFYDMELSDILNSLLDYGEWPHPYNANNDE